MVRHYLHIAVVSTLLLSGCSNLTAVRDYSATAAQSLHQLPKVIDDFSASCHRRAAVQPVIYQPDCSKVTTASTAAMAITVVMQAYVDALATLAGDDAVSFSKDFDALRPEVQRFDKVDSHTLTAVSALAKTLTRMSADHYRSGQLQQVIKNNNGAIQQLSLALSQIVSKDYQALLDAEQQAVDKQFREINARYHRSEPLAVSMLLKQKNADIAQIDQRKQLIPTVVALLENVSQGHNELTNKVDTLNSKDIIERIKRYADDVKPLLKAINKAYN